MKKILIVLLAVLFSASSAFAVWTITGTVEKKSSLGTGQKVYRIKVAAVSDGSNPASFDLSTYITDYQHEGARLYQVEVDPGVAPDAVYGIDITSDVGANLFRLRELSTTATEIFVASTSEGQIVYDVGIDFDDIGSNLDSVDIYLYFIK